MLAVPFAGLVAFYVELAVPFAGLVAFCAEFAVPFAGLVAFCVESPVIFAGLVAFVVLLGPAVPFALVVPFVKFRVPFAGVRVLQPQALA